MRTGLPFFLLQVKIASARLLEKVSYNTNVGEREEGGWRVIWRVGYDISPAEC